MKYSEVKGHHVCNLISNSREKKGCGGGEREGEREGAKKEEIKATVVILTFGEIWVKNIKEFFVLFLQLFCKFEIMSPPPTNFLIVRVLLRGQTTLPSCDQSLGLGTYEHEDTGQ